MHCIVGYSTSCSKVNIILLALANAVGHVSYSYGKHTGIHTV